MTVARCRYKPKRVVCGAQRFRGRSRAWPAATHDQIGSGAECRLLKNRMGKPDRKPDPDPRDERSVAPFEQRDFDAWFSGLEQATAEQVRLSPADAFDVGPFKA